MYGKVYVNNSIVQIITVKSLDYTVLLIHKTKTHTLSRNVKSYWWLKTL